MLYGTVGILRNIPHVHTEYGEYYKIFARILSVPHNIVMDLNNVMVLPTLIVNLALFVDSL